MKVIGITGGVGSGKSAVLAELNKEYKCKIIMADDVAKKLQEPGSKVYDEIVELLGEDVLCEDGSIDKAKMAGKIFNDGSILDKVNGIIHPAVKEYIVGEIEKEKSLGNIEYLFLEAALLIECGYKSIVDEMWYIYVNQDIRRERLKASRGYSDEKTDAIMKSQLTEENFRKESDFTFDNSGSLTKTMDEIRERLKNF